MSLTNAALAALRARGRWLALETPATHFPAGSYASLYSGLPVSEHGLYYAFQWAPEQQRVRCRNQFRGNQYHRHKGKQPEHRVMADFLEQRVHVPPALVFGL